MDFKNFTMPYSINPEYSKKVAYFSMEFAIDQALKIYSGGLGFLAGSHMRSAYNLKQDLMLTTIEFEAFRTFKNGTRHQFAVNHQNIHVR